MEFGHRASRSVFVGWTTRSSRKVPWRSHRSTASMSWNSTKDSTTQGEATASASGLPADSSTTPLRFIPFEHQSQTGSILLPRPEECSVLPDFGSGILATKFPDLQSVPSSYILKWIRTHGPQLLVGGHTVGHRKDIVEPPNKPDHPGHRPSHVLAISLDNQHIGSAPADGQEHFASRSGLIFPIHDLVYLAQCARMPTEVYRPRQVYAEDSVPIISLSVPDVSTLHMLHQWLYTHNVKELVGQVFFSALDLNGIVGQSNLSIDPADWQDFDMDELIEYVLYRSALDKEQIHRAMINFVDLYRNACAFAVVDLRLSLSTTGSNSAKVQGKGKVLATSAPYGDKLARIMAPLDDLTIHYGFWEVMEGVWKALRMHVRNLALVE